MILYCPRHNLPEFLKNRFTFSLLLLTISVIASILSIFRPYINAFALMTLIIPTVYLLWAELWITEEIDVWNLGVRSLVLMVIVNWFLMTINYHIFIFCRFVPSPCGSTIECFAIFTHLFELNFYTLFGTFWFSCHPTQAVYCLPIFMLK